MIIVVRLCNASANEFLRVSRCPLAFVVYFHRPRELNSFVHRYVQSRLAFHDEYHRQFTVEGRRPSARLPLLTKCNQDVTKVVARTNIRMRGAIFVRSNEGRTRPTFPISISKGDRQDGVPVLSTKPLGHATISNSIRVSPQFM